MFIQEIRTKRKDNKGGYTCTLIKESYRTKNGPRSRTVANISKLGETIIQVIKNALKGKILVDSSELDLDSALDFGGIAILKELWDSNNLDQLFSSFKHKKILQALIFSRILFPGSKLKLKDLAMGTALCKCVGITEEELNEDVLYAAMDELSGKWVEIERRLFSMRIEQQIDTVRIVLYDITSVYFEGKGPEHLSQYGYSRDHRSDRRQVVVALATDTTGIPIHMQVLRGNRNDQKTLLGLLNTMKRRFGIQNAIFVFDGGMSSQFNLEALEANGFDYVTRVNEKKLTAMLDGLYSKKNEPFFQLELHDQELITVEKEGKRYVIVGSKYRFKRDQERRLYRINKGESILEDINRVSRKKINVQKVASMVGRRLQTAKAHHYFDYDVNDLGKVLWSKKNDVIESEEQRDGIYILKTTLSTSQANDQDILDHYKGLIAVEHSFCQMKSFIDIRPVRHYRIDRVRNHIRLCFLSYYMTSLLKNNWNAFDVKSNVPTLLKQFQSIRVGTLYCMNQKITKLTTIPKKMNDIIQSLNLQKLFSKPPTWI